MNWSRAKDIATHGGCGLLALAIYKKCGGTPMLRYDRDGAATHAAVLLEGELVHLGDSDSGLVEVSKKELVRACKEDFDPDRVSLRAGEIEAIVKLMFPYSC